MVNFVSSAKFAPAGIGSDVFLASAALTLFARGEQGRLIRKAAKNILATSLKVLLTLPESL